MKSIPPPRNGHSYTSPSLVSCAIVRVPACPAVLYHSAKPLQASQRQMLCRSWAPAVGTIGKAAGGRLQEGEKETRGCRMYAGTYVDGLCYGGGLPMPLVQ